MNTVTSTDTTEAELAQAISALPPLPNTAQQILTCFGDEFINADKVTAIIEGDPAIAAKLLGLANSAFFGLVEPINKLQDAICRVLGVDTVRSLALVMAVQQAFDSKRCPGFDAARFWAQSLLTAECCKKIAGADEQADDVILDLVYCAGLCQNLGLMALAHMEPQRTSAVLIAHQANGEPDSLCAMLTSEFGTDHRKLTAELAQHWLLPAPMVSAYQYRAFPESQCEHRLGLIVAAGASAIENLEADDEHQASLDVWAAELGTQADTLQGMAAFGDRQKERVESLAGNMTV